MKTRVALILHTFNPETNQYFVLGQGKTYTPQFCIYENEKDQNLEDVARDLFSRYVDIDKNWATIKLINCYSSNGTLYVDYATEVPIDSNFKLPAFFDVKNLSDSPHYESIIKTMRNRDEGLY